MLYEQAFDETLLDATEALIREHPGVPAGRVISAVARAKVHVRELYGATGARLPSTDGVLATILAMARRDLDEFDEARTSDRARADRR